MHRVLIPAQIGSKVGHGSAVTTDLQRPPTAPPVSSTRTGSSRSASANQLVRVEPTSRAGHGTWNVNSPMSIPYGPVRRWANRNERMETIMNDQARSPALPHVVDRKTWQEAREALLAREKAHTREGDAIAAARRRLPMVELDATIEVIGPHGPITILDVFEGRKQLIAYYHAWWPGQPAAEQCEGCTFFNSQVRELSYIHSRDATYATLCKGPYEESVRYRDFLGLDMPWYSVEKTARATPRGS